MELVSLAVGLCVLHIKRKILRSATIAYHAKFRKKNIDVKLNQGAMGKRLEHVALPRLTLPVRTTTNHFLKKIGDLSESLSKRRRPSSEHLRPVRRDARKVVRVRAMPERRVT